MRNSFSCLIILLLLSSSACGVQTPRDETKSEYATDALQNTPKALQKPLDAIRTPEYRISSYLKTFQEAQKGNWAALKASLGFAKLTKKLGDPIHYCKDISESSANSLQTCQVCTNYKTKNLGEVLSQFICLFDHGVRDGKELQDFTIAKIEQFETFLENERELKQVCKSFPKYETSFVNSPPPGVLPKKEELSSLQTRSNNGDFEAYYKIALWNEFVEKAYWQARDGYSIGALGSIPESQFSVYRIEQKIWARESGDTSMANPAMRVFVREAQQTWKWVALAAFSGYEPAIRVVEENTREDLCEDWRPSLSYFFYSKW